MLGQGLVDRTLFLPRDWAEDRERCRQAGIPETVEHKPKAELARDMLVRASWPAG
ncbi:transposase [Modicisalibacter xianhensis]|uniref:transposase n=1 Tax=Modicisalibacter xianhensis TaxID=442341 RepID=UPI003BF4F46E